ncbi:MAG: hypothetical protein JXA25_01080 [Anaerolineales bacterium]|nr:hypothetical protein [Anaerolineales bacterium]
MDDYLDDALQKLPSEPYPESLTGRIMLQVVREQRKRRQLKFTGWAAAAGAALYGTIQISGWWVKSGDVIPAFSVKPILEWAGRFSTSPQQALLGSTLSFWDWTRLFAAQFDWLVVAALLLLLTAGMWGLYSLMLESDRDEVLWV